MSDKLKPNLDHNFEKFRSAYDHFPNSKHLQWNVSETALGEMLMLRWFVDRSLLDTSNDRYIGVMLYRLPVMVYITDKLADGLAELVDLDTNDRATISVEAVAG